MLGRTEDHDIVRLYVAMCDAHRVQIGECVAEVARDDEGQLDASARFEVRDVESRAVRPLEREIRKPRFEPGRTRRHEAGIDDTSDAHRVDQRQQLRLVGEGLTLSSTMAHLEGHQAAVTPISRPKHAGRCPTANPWPHLEAEAPGWQLRWRR